MTPSPFLCFPPLRAGAMWALLLLALSFAPVSFAQAPQTYATTMGQLLGLKDCTRTTRELGDILSGPAPNRDARQSHLRRTERLAERLALQDQTTRQQTMVRAREGLIRELRELQTQGDPLASWWIDRLPRASAQPAR